MKRFNLLHIIAVFAVLSLLACSESDDEWISTPVQPRTLSQTESPEPDQPVNLDARPAVDFAAEETAILKLIAHQDAALSEHNIDAVMDDWLRKNTRDVFMVQTFLDAINIIETWRGVRDSWQYTWQHIGKRKVESTIETVAIDARGQQATASGQFDTGWGWWKGDLMVALKKDKGEWKIRAIDYGDQGLIKEMSSPRTESQ